MKPAVFITGSTKGIGKATALKAIEKGYFAYLNYAHDDVAAEVCSNEFRQMGYADNYCIIKADASDIEAIPDLIEQINFNKHILSALVLNASSGGKYRNSFGQITLNEMEAMFQINVFAPFFLVQALADKIHRGGSIVFVSSNVGTYPHSTYIPYGLTKASEIFLAKMLVKEFSDRGIRVNAVAPAFIETDMFPGNRTKEHIDSIRDKIALHRFGKPEEVADAIMGAVMNEYMNGNVIAVDGGYNYK